LVLTELKTDIESVAPQNIVILGSSGFIGSRLRHLLSRDRNRSVVGWSLPGQDLSKTGAIEQLRPMVTEQTTLILAAAVKRQFGDNRDVYRNNMAIVENICELLETSAIRQLIFMSSSAVYGEETENLQIDESTPVNPTSYYGMAKYASERLLRKACQTNGKTILACLRSPLVYGPNDQGRTYGPSGFCAAALAGEPIVLWGDGTELREFIYIDDLCRIIELVVARGFDGELNIVSGVRQSFAEVVALLKRIKPDLRVESRPRSKTKADNAFDARKIRALLPKDFEFTTLEEGLALTLGLHSLSRGVYGS